MLLRRFAKKNDKGIRRPGTGVERRLLFSVLAAGLPGIILSFLLLWTNPYSLDHKIEGSVVALVLWTSWSISARDGVVHSIRVLSNVVASVRAEDFSFRATPAVAGDAFSDLSIEINNLARLIETERLSAVEAESLLRKVTSEVEAVILAFCPEHKVRLLNRAAVSFLGKQEEEVLDHTATELGVDYLLNGPPLETISRVSGGMERRWIARRTYFREDGIPHRLVMLSDASDALRAEERLAWQRLVRVLSHEINNSLAPVKSIVRTLTRIADSKLSEDVRESFVHGLDVIGGRTEALNRFLQGYARLTRVPPPVRRPVSLAKLVERVAGLEARLKVNINPAPDTIIDVDPDQIEQALINLTRNAVDAVLAKSESKISPVSVTISWSVSGSQLNVRIIDQGIGLLDTSNLFVPFYTTKETGTGIGLLLSRQIVEAHDGSLMLYSHEDPRGCEVEIRIPACVVSQAPSQDMN